jgi:hypothetical protein
MIRLGIFLLVVGLMLQFAARAQPAAESSETEPEFKEVFDLIRTHLTGTTEAELDHKAVQALVAALSPRVSLVGGSSGTNARTEGSLISKSSSLDDGIAYVRLARVDDGAAQGIRQTCSQLMGTNQLAGIILDLRYTAGTDYPAAAATADLFLSKEQPLLDWGNGVVTSKTKSDALAVPVAVLVNHETAGGAEALAARMRQTGTGLLLGNRTAGKAMIAEEFPLKNGQKLRIATAPIQLGDGSSLSAQGVTPDITVDVTPQSERIYYADAFKELSPSNLAGALALTNQSGANNLTNRRPRLNEAELVRERRDGFFLDADSTATRPSESDKPQIQDPVLARALDVLKGLAMVRRQRS